MTAQQTKDPLQRSQGGEEIDVEERLPGVEPRLRCPKPAKFLVINTPVSAAPASGAGGAGPTASRLRGQGVLGDGLGASEVGHVPLDVRND